MTAGLLAALCAICVAAWLIIRWRLSRLRCLFESRLPVDVTRRDGWWCRASARPGVRVWVTANIISEHEVVDALLAVGELYRGWVPLHRLVGRGLRSRWVCVLRRPSGTPVAPSLIGASPDGRIMVGIGLDGRPVTVSETASVLTVGLTGSGKGSMMATMVASLGELCREDLLRLVGIDLKGGVEMSLYEGVFARHAYTLKDALALLRDLTAECDRRMELMRGATRNWGAGDRCRIILFIDEAAELNNRNDRKTSDEALVLLDSILRRGRALGVTVVAFSQDPRLASFPLRDRFPQRIALRLNSRTEAQMLLGEDAVRCGAAPWLISPTLPGSGYVWDAEHGETRYFRSVWFSDDDIRKLGA